METQLNLPHLSRSPDWCDQVSAQIDSCLNTKVFRVFFFALVGSNLATGALLIAALSFPISVTLLPAALIGGGVAGATATLFFEWLASGTTEDYEELRQVARAYQGTPRMMEAIQAVEQFVKTNPIQLDQSYDYHNFHHELTVITEQVKTRADLRGIWETFLNRIEGRTIYQPTGNAGTLCTGMERERLAGRTFEVITERLDPGSPLFNRDTEQAFAIAEECFGGNTSSRSNAMRAAWRNPRNQIHLAKRQDTGEVLGYVWAREERDQQGRELLHICNVARKAEACSIGVANRLFQQVFAQPLNRFSSVYLEVRESNQDAIALYTRWGFRSQQVHTNYFTHPLENAHVMTRAPVVT
ncbi:MAG: GNAT family N-acetyltransferase [Parachlamydiales bacterium]